MTLSRYAKGIQARKNLPKRTKTPPNKAGIEPIWTSEPLKEAPEPEFEPMSAEYHRKVAQEGAPPSEISSLFADLHDAQANHVLSARPPEEELGYWRKEYKRRLQERVRALALAEEDTELQKALMRRYKDDPVAWTNDWTWTRDPRWAGVEGMGVEWPFYMFPKQQALMEWLDWVAGQMTDGVVPKPRDMGGTEVIIKRFVHDWLFNVVELGVGSRTEPYVKVGPPKSLLSKVKYTLEKLPHWMLPEGFSFREHITAMMIRNPANGSLIEGEIGKEIGRGDRKSRVLVDEAGFLPWPDDTEAALSATSNTAYWLSTIPPGGKHSWFGRKTLSGTIPVFEWTWRDDPRKTERWYKFQCTKYAHNPNLLAREIDMAWEIANENMLFPSHWLEYCVENGLQAVGPNTAGFDPAGAAGEHAEAFRKGPVVYRLDGWRDTDPTTSGIKAVRRAEQQQCQTFIYDESGLGQGLGATYQNLEPYPSLTWIPFVGAQTASRICYADEPQINANLRFHNLRSETYWALRMRAYFTYERLSRGILHPEHMCLCLPADRVLLRQMCELQYTYHKQSNRILIESKSDMRARGVSSPDRADAVAMAFAEPEAVRREHVPGPDSLFIGF